MIYFNMDTIKNNNGNTQINSTRNSFNTNVSRLRMLGASKKIAWDGMRRNRSI